MNCTAFGLLTGISALLAYSILNGKTQAMIDELNYFTLKGVPDVEGDRARQETYLRLPIKAPGPHLTHTVGLGKGHGGKGGHSKKKSTFREPPAHADDRHVHRGAHLLLMTFSAWRDPVRHQGHQAPFADNVEKLDRAPVIAISFPENDPGRWSRDPGRLRGLGPRASSRMTTTPTGRSRSSPSSSR